MSGFICKCIAVILMVLDHTRTQFLNVGIEFPLWFNYLGRLSAPIFFYFMVEGFLYTHSRFQYAKRLFVMGAVMVVIDIVFGITNNIMLSLGCCVLMLTFWEEYKYHSKKYGFLSILFGILALFTEASFYGVGMTWIFYIFHNQKIKLSFCYALFSMFSWISWIGMSFTQFQEAIWYWDFQWLMVFALIPILLYNGQRGYNNRFIQWAFYWFYPVHLILIVLLSYIYL